MRGAFAAIAVCAACGGTHAGAPDAHPDAAASAPDAPAPDAGFPATLDGNRDRLIHTYYARLASIPTVTQQNGLRGADLPDVCALWSALPPSARDVFLTLTHRLDGAVIAADGSRALDHVVSIYRLDGGQGATSTDAGSCGGGEFNRMLMHMDAALHDVQVAANDAQGPSSAPLMADIKPSGYWRDSHDLGGPHAPFDLSDETNDGAPRGQTQYFRDPSSTAANAPLGRTDVETVVDPYALEMDQDYDCTHNSNPDCDYVFYGPACAPESSAAGTDIYVSGYGDFEPAWKPTGC